MTYITSHAIIGLKNLIGFTNAIVSVIFVAALILYIVLCWGWLCGSIMICRSIYGGLHEKQNFIEFLLGSLLILISGGFINIMFF